jgi:hypothetical protein
MAQVFPTHSVRQAKTAEEADRQVTAGGRAYQRTKWTN